MGEIIHIINYRFSYSLFIPCCGLCSHIYQIFAKLHTPHERLCRPVSDCYLNTSSVQLSFQDFKCFPARMFSEIVIASTFAMAIMCCETVQNVCSLSVTSKVQGDWIGQAGSR